MASQIKPAYESQALNLLLAGAGTLRRMDYPSFSLACRPSATLIGLKTLAELINLAKELQSFHASISSANAEAVVNLVSDKCQEMRGITLPAVTCQEIISTFERHVIGYVLLKTRILHSQLAQAPFRLRRKHIRRFWTDHAAGQLADLTAPETLAELRRDYALDLIEEGLAHALLDYLHHAWPCGDGQMIVLKEEFSFALRLLALVYTLEPPLFPWPTAPIDEAGLECGNDLVDFLLKQIKHAPLELAQALLLPPSQGLPLLNGGQETELERRFQRLLREVAGGAVEAQPGSDVSQHFTCRPLSKIAALDRGALGGDCSSGSVPLRALSPHHVYYGLFAGEVQQRGYLTVYEAWAETEAGERLPVLCLETINVPLPHFNSVQQDLLLIFEAIAKSRGLYPHLVLITEMGTWNYQNGELLRQSRRFRQGRPVRLGPADPVHWQLYDRLTVEADYYNAFNRVSPHHKGLFRLLAPFQADFDRVQPENLAEAQRLAALPVRKLVVTARSEHGVAGFISELPVAL